MCSTPVPGENDGVALYISHESVPAALPQGNEPMEWIHCMLVAQGSHSIHFSTKPGSLAGFLWLCSAG